MPLASFRRFLSALESLGIEISLRNPHRTGLEFCDRAAHLLWGTPIDESLRQAISQQPNVFFVENGWLSPAHGFCLDKLGVNAQSSIPGILRREPSIHPNHRAIEQTVNRLHRAMNLKPVRGEGEYILLPLQCEADSQIRKFSCCDAPEGERLAWFVAQVCGAFARHPIVVRPHPRDREATERIARLDAVRRHGAVQFRSDGTCYDWIAGARAVVGVNSTVLSEALTLMKPVCAFGRGVFSDNDVVLEANGNPAVLPAVLAFWPDRQQVLRYLGILLERQIPYDLRPEQVTRHPVLMDFLNASMCGAAA